MCQAEARRGVGHAERVSNLVFLALCWELVLETREEAQLWSLPSGDGMGMQ
jgi:hypothetical protein